MYLAGLVYRLGFVPSQTMKYVCTGEEEKNEDKANRVYMKMEYESTIRKHRQNIIIEMMKQKAAATAPAKFALISLPSGVIFLQLYKEESQELQEVFSRNVSVKKDASLLCALRHSQRFLNQLYCYS